MRALAAIALAACSGTTPSPALRGNAPAQTPSGSAPVIRWDGSAFERAGLPAISRAGDRVVLGIADSDERGWLNLRLEVRDRADHTLSTQVVMKPGEGDRLLPDGITPTPELEARIADANRMLADLHGARDLIAMRPLDVKHLPVEFIDDRVRVTIDGRVVAELDARAWIGCSLPPMVENAYQADGINVVVIDIAFLGDGSCVFPSQHMHVIAW